MFFKSRFLRWSLVALGVVAFAGYFAFTTFFFNPFESDLDVDVAVLAPRDVDFYVAKADLGKLFDPFPELALAPEFAQGKLWQTWLVSPERQTLERDLDLQRSLADLKTQLAQIPLGADLLDVFGGSDLALVGYFRGAQMAQADWAVYGRANWMGKLAASALNHPTWFGLEQRGLVAVPNEQFVELSGPQLPRKLYITRIHDVVVVATTADLVRKAHELQEQQYADSLHQSAYYHDSIQSRDRVGDEAEVFVNMRKLLEQSGFKGEMPDSKSQDFLPAFTGRLFQVGSMKNAMGIVGHDGGLQVDLHGEFSSELIHRDQEKLYRTRGFDRAQLMNDAAVFAPADTALFAYVHGHVGDLLRQVLASIEPAMRQNIEDAFRSTGKYQNLEQLVGQLDGALKDRAALIVRPNDYPPDPSGPPNDGTKVPAVALVLWTTKPEAIVELRDNIGNNGSKFGLKGRNENEIGYFKAYEAGFETREFWNALIPGTGVIATVNAGEVTIITNSFRMLGHLLKVQTQGAEKGGERYARLSDDARFDALVQSAALPRSNLLLWINPDTFGPIARDAIRQGAGSSVSIDWKTITPLESKKLLRESYGGRDEKALSAEEKTAFDAELEKRLEAIRKRAESQQVTTATAQQEHWVDYIEGTTGVLAMLALDPKSWDLALRAPARLVRVQ